MGSSGQSCGGRIGTSILSSPYSVILYTRGCIGAYLQWRSLLLCRNQVLLPEDATESIRTPAMAAFLENVALRDLALHETHAACVDARGDIYQWGDGFYNSSTSESQSQNRGPKLTLSGKVRTFIPFLLLKIGIPDISYLCACRISHK